MNPRKKTSLRRTRASEDTIYLKINRLIGTRSVMKLSYNRKFTGYPFDLVISIYRVRPVWVVCIGFGRVTYICIVYIPDTFGLFRGKSPGSSTHPVKGTPIHQGPFVDKGIIIGPCNDFLGSEEQCYFNSWLNMWQLGPIIGWSYK